MEILGTIFLAVLGIALIAIVIGTFFMWLGAKMAGVENATFGRSVLAAVGAVFVTWLVSWLLSVFPGIGTAIGFIIGLILTIFVIKAAYKVDFGKAFLVWIFHVVAEILAIIVGVMTFASVLLTLFR